MASRHEIVSIDFRANAGKANPAIESLRKSAEETNKEITKLKDNLAKGGSEAQVADWTKQLNVQEKKLKALQNAENNLIKGVGTLNQAIEAFNNGSLDQMSAKFQKTAKNALELQKTQLNPNSETYKKDLAELEAIGTRLTQNMQRMKLHTDDLIATIQAGGKFSKAELNQEIQGLTELLDLIPKGTKEWKRYNDQLTALSATQQKIVTEEAMTTGKQTLGRAFRGDFATADIKTVENVIAKLREYRSLIDDPNGKGARHVQATEAAIEKLSAQLGNTKGQIVSVEQALHVVDAVTGNLVKTVTTVDDRVRQATATTRANLDTLEGKIESTTGEIRRMESAMAELNQPQNVVGLIEQMEQVNAEYERQKEAKAKMIVASAEEHVEREKIIEAQRQQVAAAEAEKKAYENNIKSIEGQIKYEEKHLQLLRETKEQMQQGAANGAAQPTEDNTALIEQHEKILVKLKERKAAMEAANQTTTRLAEANELLAASIKAYEEATARSKAALQALDGQMEATKADAAQMQQQLNAMYNPDAVQQLETELARLTAEYNQQKEARAKLIEQAEKERIERERNIESIKQQISTLDEESKKAVQGYVEKSNAIDKEMDKLRNLQRARERAAAARDKAQSPEDAEFTAKTGFRGQSLEQRYPVEAIDNMINATERSIAALQKQRDEMDASITSTAKRLGIATKDLTQAILENEQATKADENALKEYDANIKKLEDDIARYTKQLEAAKNAQNTQEYQRMAQQLQQLQGELTQMNAQREQLIATMQREAEEATRLAEAEKAAAVAEQEGISVEKMEQAAQILEAHRKKIDTNTEAYKKEGEAFDILTEKIKVAKGEWMSYAEAEKYAESIGTDGFIATSDQLQKVTQSLTRYKDTLIKTIQQKREDGKATAEEEAKLKEVEAELKKMKFEMDNANMSSKRMHEILKDPKSAKNIEELSAAIKRSTQELKLMEETIGKDNAKYKEMAEQTKKATIEQKNMEAQFKASSSAFEKAWSRLKTYVGLYVGAAVAMQKIVATMGDLMELSDKMGEVRKTTGFTADEVGRLSDNLKKLDVRTSLTSLMELSSLAGSVGLKTQQDVQGFTEAANQLLIALPEMGNESARTLIKIAQATGDLQKNGGDVRETLEKVGSTIIALRANSASAAGPITDFVSRVGAVGAQAGISIDQIAALGSTIDALGGRVEMSATALSRMIPAIRNNSYAIANSIGVTESYLKSLAPMEQMVLIFQKMRDSIKGIDTSTEEGQKQMADNVEAILGKSSTMREVMKDLEQQGARAGIVFGLLSQNVDELQKQLGIAGEAYKDNIALQEEFNKMNDTTAAKWARLKNQLEEMFVSDSMQRFLGWIIDRLRALADLLSGNVNSALQLVTVTLRTFLVYWGLLKLGLGEAVFVKSIAGLKALYNGLANLITNTKLYIAYSKQLAAARMIQTEALRKEKIALIEAEMAQKGLNKAMLANIWTALALAIAYTVYQLVEWVKEMGKVKAIAREALASATGEIERTTEKVDKLFDSVNKTRDAVGDASVEVKKAEKAVKDAKKALDEGRGSVEDLEEAENDLKIAHEKVAAANNEHTNSLQRINKEYSPYLGYMLSEISTAAELANARELINAKLRETILLKQQEAAYGRVETEYGEGRDKKRKSLYDEIGDAVKDPEKAAQLRKDLNDLIKQYQGVKDAFAIPAREEWDEYRKIVNSYKLGLSTTDYLDLQNAFQSLFMQEQKIAEAKKVIDESFEADLKAARTGTRTTKGTQQELRDQLAAIEEGDKDIQNGLADLEKRYKEADAKSRKQRAADLLRQMDAYESLLGNAKSYFDLENEKEKEAYDKLIKDGDRRMKGLRDQREKLIKDAGDAYRPAGTGGGGGGNTNPYGNFNRVTSPYGDWDADSLVARRKEMLERVRSLANGADVQKVLSEDAKFISEAVRKNIKTTEQAIEWYNAERLKIQDALHEKHLTPSGDWENPTVKKAREKQLKAEWKAYFDELDAYYTERKAKIQQAQTDEGLSEEEAQRQIVLNEQIWRQRRMELGKMFADKSAEVTDGEQQAIYQIIADRQEDTVDMVEKSIAQVVKFSQEIGKKSPEELRDYMGKLDKQIQQDFLKQQNAISKQLNAIRDIIAKERPYDGITDNLRKSLSTMGILLADFEAQAAEAVKAGKEPVDDQAARAEAEMQRLAFVLQQAESAYTLTVEEMMKRMADAGMKAWADELEKNPQMQQALLASLRKTYDEIQAAIKKEATLIKKEVDIWWADIAPVADQSRKDTFERALSQMGLLEDSVKRANQLIGAGQASERVADKLAIKQMQIRLAMQATYYNKMREVGLLRIKQLKDAGKLEDAEHLQKSLNLALTQEQVKLDEQRVAIANKLEESQDRLYTAMREYADLIYSSMQSVFEASNAGAAEFYNERAKLQLTGGTGETQQYIIIDNAGTSDATAHYETLNEMQAAERKFEIERQNAQAEAWKKVMDDINMKMSETITDQINAMMQNASIDANTDALSTNTRAIIAMTETMGGQGNGNIPGMDLDTSIPTGSGESGAESGMPLPVEDGENAAFEAYKAKMDASAAAKDAILQDQKDIQQGEKKTDQVISASSQSAFAKMTQAANLYGIAYQAMSNDNLSTEQKFEMIALQAAGNAAMAALTANWSKDVGQVEGSLPAILAECLKINPIWGSVIFAGLTALLGGLMGIAAGKIAKSKSEIASATGTSNSVASGRLVTGMLTYAEGNVNEFTDPASLTPGRSYNVDAADGRTYRARYMGRNPRTHITNGPEFHLAGERGREAIIDAHTTRQIQMDDSGIWAAIKTLSAGGSIHGYRSRRSGMRAFAEGNISEFSEYSDYSGVSGGSGMSAEQMLALQSSLDRNSEVLERAVTEGIKGIFNVYGKGGLVDSYDTGKKTAQRYGQRY